MSDIVIQDWIHLFPMKTPRPNQIEVINRTLNAFRDGIQTMLLDLPTGQGKSAIAVTVARYMAAQQKSVSKLVDAGAYFLTTQKILQEQYLRDFENESCGGMLELKSSTNYTCGYDERQSCGESKRALMALGKNADGTNWKRHCTQSCVYNDAKRRFMNGVIGITNYSFFLAETTYVGKLEPRELLVADECLRGDARIMLDWGQEATIEEIYNNEQLTHVMSYNEIHDVYERKRITRRVRTIYDRDTQWVEITLMTIDGKSTKLLTTNNHKIWTKNRGYIRADQLTIEDTLKFDTSLKELLPSNSRRRKQLKELRASQKLIKYTCIWCSHAFETYAYKRHIENIILAHCLTCEKPFEISSDGQKYCSHKCYSACSVISQKRAVRMRILNPMFDAKLAKRVGSEVWARKSEEDKRVQIERFRKAPLHQNRKKPNKLERFVIDLHIPEVEFVGLGEKWIKFTENRYKNPDFLVKNQKKVIEVGDIEYWHTLDEIEEVKAAYANVGYECLYLTNREITGEPTKCCDRILKFVYNHDVKITNIRILNRPKNFTKSPTRSTQRQHFKYNIEVEDNHNYFANSVLVSNCHNLESEICKFVEVEITDRFCKKYLGINLSSYDDHDKLFKWMSEKYKPALGSMFEQVKKSLSMFKDNDGGYGNDEMFKTLVKQNDLLDKHICKVNRFLERFQPEAWIVNRDKRSDHRGERVALQFKPIDAVAWSETSLLRFGDKRLLMSATILDKSNFCRSLGLEEQKTDYISLPSSFPAKNRPIHYLPVGKMSMKEVDTTLPKLAEAIKEILKAHHDQKGIIHCSNYKVARYLRDMLNDSRLLVHSDVDRDQVLKHHYESIEPTVLVSPSMTEGVDLKDDFARFAIIAKLPYPNLGDRALKKRITRDPWYYDYLTVRSFVQALGRSVRHESDTCITYMLDGCTESFINKNRNLIPEYVQEAIT